MQIVFLDKKTIGEVTNFNLLHKLGTVDVYEHTREDDVVSRAVGKQVIITNKVVVNREMMEALPDLKLICVAATGTNNIDLAMLLHLLNRLSYYEAYVKSGAYAKGDIFTHHGPAFWELNGKRLGVIGLGNIGRRVAKIAEGFGMEVVFYSTTGRNNNINYKRFDLDTLMGTSDVVSIHAPLTETTMDLISYETNEALRHFTEYRKRRDH